VLSLVLVLLGVLLGLRPLGRVVDVGRILLTSLTYNFGYFSVKFGIKFQSIFGINFKSKFDLVHSYPGSRRHDGGRRVVGLTLVAPVVVG